ncbi:alpha/beta hydrolase [Actinocrispum sp. NPDC049592]|uniref:alpha/beta hydrolase n=1 Tax=Actinocrispum sp. NPDC049592 TaxID=3154835 RepID=UPI0034422658
MRRSWGLGALGVLTALVTACSSVVSGTPVAVQLTKAGPAGPVPAGLERFYGQPLSWGSCSRFAEDEISEQLYGGRELDCALLTVPIDYAQPQGKTAQLGLLRKKATSQSGRVGAVVLNPGGPGESGMTAAASIAKDNWTGELGKRFDLVGFDPRGVGASTPRVKCLSDKEKDAERLEPPIEGADAVARIEKKNQEFAGKCAAATGKDLLANVGTRDVARDMDVLRSVLGEQKLTYLGYSYGTRIGTAYAEAFPGNVRAMVLDGAVEANSDRVTQKVGQINGFKKAFDEYAKSCAQKQTCPLGTDPAQAEAQLDKMLEPLKKQPLAVGDRQMSYSDATIAVAQGLYSDQLWDPLTQGLQDLAKGKGGLLLRFSDFYQGRDDSGRYTGVMDAFTAIHCVDEPPVKDRAVVEDETRRVKAAAPPSPVEDEEDFQPALDTCAFWPVPNTGAPHEPKTAGLPKLLVISTTNDPATPYQAGVNLAKSLGAGLLTVEGTRHTAYLQDILCVDKLVDAYLIDLKQPAEGTKCS